jgi:hypothetical protein
MPPLSDDVSRVSDGVSGSRQSQASEGPSVKETRGATVSSGKDEGKDEMARRGLSQRVVPGETRSVVPDDEFATEWVYYDEEEGERSRSSAGKARL